MIRFQKLLIVGLFVCLAAAQRARCQSIHDLQLTTQTNSGKTAKAGNIRRSENTRAIPKESPLLSFQPGIGWRRVPLGKLSGAGSPGSGNSDKVDALRSAAGANPQSVYAPHNTAKQELAPELAMEDVTTGNHAKTESFAHSTSVNLGSLAALPGNTLFSPAMGAASGRRRMAMTSVPSDSQHLSAGTEPGVSSGPVRDLQSHAYISSILLRRMIRTAPDLQTRIKLQELQNKLSNQSHTAKVNSRGNQATKMQSTIHHDRANYSSSMRGGHRSAGDSTMALSSNTHP
jgi:hypothetical protein